MKKDRYDFYRTLQLVRAFSYRLFSRSVFDFQTDGFEDFEKLLTETYLSFFEQRERALLSVERTLGCLPYIYDLLITDAESIFMSDPAASCIDEVISCYPGFFAIMCHRLSHTVYNEGACWAARFIGEYAHSLTGIDIHPGAVIGERFSIDHGTGVVIGETSVIGRRVKIYQGVTIGAKSFPRDELGNFDRSIKRHPTIGDGCTIYANATILGGDTVIGDNSVIGANVWITSSVPKNSKIYYGRN